MARELGLTEVTALGVGGLIGGGIFAVLGVAADLAGEAALYAYLLAGTIALLSGYSYARLTARFHEAGGSFTFLEHYVDNRHIAGLVGWVLIVGYVGTMAMYAYAFGAFGVELLGLAGVLGLRSLLSIGVIGLFIGINMLGTDTTGTSEDLLVYAKVAILLLFGLIGGAAVFARQGTMALAQTIPATVMDPVFAVGAIFVSFEGFQLLTYELDAIEGGTDTLQTGILASIAISTGIYLLVAFVTTSLLSPAAILQHKETVLAFAAAEIFGPGLIRSVAYLLVAVAALFSTASAINATLFGTARLTERIAQDDELPQVFSFRNSAGIPTRSILLIGGLTAVFTVLGSLEQITTFASVAFVLIFGLVNFLCWHDDQIEATIVPLAGFLLTAALIPLVIYHYYHRQPGLLLWIGGIFVALLALEFLFIEREEIAEEVDAIEDDVEELEDEVEQEVEREWEQIRQDIETIEVAIEE